MTLNGRSSASAHFTSPILSASVNRTPTLAFRQVEMETTHMKQLTKAPAFGALTAATETAISDHQMAALIDAASYRHGSRQAALRSQFEAAATEIRAQFLAGVARLQAGEGEAA
jgi:hypothetical protein